MPKKTDAVLQPPESFEAALSELEQLAQAVENGSLGLDAMLSQYQRSAELVRYCKAKLQSLEEQVKRVDDALDSHALPDAA